jgi:hypothetical protein
MPHPPQATSWGNPGNQLIVGSSSSVCFAYRSEQRRKEGKPAISDKDMVRIPTKATGVENRPSAKIRAGTPKSPCVESRTNSQYNAQNFL